jgi:L-asparaginase
MTTQPDQHQDIAQPRVLALTTGGSIDKFYGRDGEMHIGSPCLSDLLAEAQSQQLVDVFEVLRKDSLDLTAEDRSAIRDQILGSSQKLVLITHGTDTMVDTAAALHDINDKTIILTGALQPRSMPHSDAAFNIGLALGHSPSCHTAKTQSSADSSPLTKTQLA